MRLRRGEHACLQITVVPGSDGFCGSGVIFEVLGAKR
jgi:hypothetical protein